MIRLFSALTTAKDISATSKKENTFHGEGLLQRLNRIHRRGGLLFLKQDQAVNFYGFRADI